MTESKKAAHDGATVTNKRYKDNAIFRLRQLYLTEHYKNLPSIPPQCRCTPLYKPTTANGLTRMVIDWLRLSGHQTERVGNTGRLIDRSKIVYNCIGQARRIGSVEWIKGTGTDGTSDIHAVVKGMAIKIEIKAGKDRQSEAQRRYQESIERNGGVYMIVRTFEDFLNWYDQFIKDTP